MASWLGNLEQSRPTKTEHILAVRCQSSFFENSAVAKGWGPPVQQASDRRALGLLWTAVNHEDLGRQTRRVLTRIDRRRRRSRSRTGGRSGGRWRPTPGWPARLQ